ncbi:hypothetical protein [Roseateles sp. BYS87W]|uniref:Uncharacterized protein n=1 Tax=Pelomonas baiyunensis TaxID=3299026 RepID=A0ABW7H5M4_9BURK
MKPLTVRHWVASSVALALLAARGLLVAQPTEVVGKDQSRLPGDRSWIERPWEHRYFVFISGDWAGHKAASVKLNEEPGQTYFGWKAIFSSTKTIAAKVNPEQLAEPQLDVVLVEFDKEGFVVSPHSHGRRLRGRLNELLSLVLSEGDERNSKQYWVAKWFPGLGDVSTHWAPGFCDIKSFPGPFSRTDTLYLYGPKFEKDEFSRTFGCREWAYQLYDDARPYIDVTSYVPKGDTDPAGSYIRDVMGWARFGDKKPIIGKHEYVWYCLLDCPGGAAPGAIPDIKVWAAANGWRPPKPPTKSPTFPDPPAKAGTYPP